MQALIEPLSDDGLNEAFGKYLDRIVHQSDANAAREASYLAWILATHEDARVRRPAVAVRLAEAACRINGGEPEYQINLGAAYAAAGKFSPAVKSLQAVAKQLKTNDPRQELIEQRVQQYRLRVAHRMPAAVPFETDDPSNHRRVLSYLDHLLGRRLMEEDDISAAVEVFSRGLRADPTDLRLHLELVALAQELGDDAIAARHLAAAAQLRPADAQLAYRAGFALQRAGEVSAAMHWYRQALELRPGWNDPANNLAWLLATSEIAGQKTVAEAVFLAERACRATHFEHVEYLDTLAAAYALAGRFDEAVTTMQQATALAASRQLDSRQSAGLRSRRLLYEAGRPYREGLVFSFPEVADDAEWHRTLGTALFALGQLELARAHYEAALKHEPDDYESLNRLGVVHSRNDRPWQAVRWFAHALRVKPQEAAPAVNLGWILATTSAKGLNSPREAVLFTQLAIESKGTLQWRTLQTLAAALAATGSFERAVAAADEALQLARAERSSAIDDVVRQREAYATGQLPAEMLAASSQPTTNEIRLEAFFQLGLLAFQQGRSDDAVRHFQAALNIDSNRADLYDALGSAWAQAARYDEAAAAYRRAIELDAAATNSLNNLAWLLATRPDGNASHAAKALQLAQRFTGQQEETPALLLDTLAAAQAACGDFSAAVATLEQALASERAADGRTLVAGLESRRKLYAACEPFRDDASRVLHFDARYCDLHLRLGAARLNQGDAAEALRHFRGALAHRADSRVMTHLGTAYLALGDPRAADEAFRQALVHNPANSEAANNLAWIWATAEHASPSEVRESVVLAEQVCAITGFDSAGPLDTLAAAYAANSRFADAASAVRAAMEIVSRAGDSQTMDELQEKLALYLNRQPPDETPAGEKSGPTGESLNGGYLRKP